MEVVLRGRPSGGIVWKPVQLQKLAVLMGGYEGARLVHFLSMAAICAFIVLHLPWFCSCPAR